MDNKGKTRLCTLYLLIVTQSLDVIALFIHEPSRIEIRPQDRSGTDFGYSIAYQPGNRANLVIGSPHSNDSIGQVYTCPMDDILEGRPYCTKVNIDVNNLTSYATKEGVLNPRQSFCLGASIAVTPNYIMTCAPLWTTQVKTLKSPRPESWATGTCFYFNETTAFRHKGVVEQYNYIMNTIYNKHSYLFNAVIGGTGWNTLADKTNGLILTAKPTWSRGDIVYSNMSQPMQPTESLLLYRWERGPKLDKQLRKTNMEKLQDHINVGQGLAMGNFFSDQTYYAFSTEDNSRNGKIFFVDKDRHIIARPSKEVVTISGPYERPGSMFGAAMTAADVTQDGTADLLVGAPAHCVDESEYDVGALFIYIGGDMDNINSESRQRVIFAIESGSRFGTAIATSDIDGDGLPEIFVGAPYEGSGTIYVFSGYDVKRILISNSLMEASIPDLPLTQRIQMDEFKTLGFSFQVVPDVDDNGCDEMAVGAPRSTSVMFLKCIPAVNATLTTELVDEIVSDSDISFTVKVCVIVTYHRKPVNISSATELTVTNEILGKTAASVVVTKPNFTVTLSPRKDQYCEDVVVRVSYSKTGPYNFISKIQDATWNQGMLSKKEFNNSWVTLSPYSETESNLQVQLDMILQWAGHSTKEINYDLGSSETEKVTVMVMRNEQNETAEKCVRLRMSNAHVASIGCDREDTGAYKCQLPRVMEEITKINVVLSMSKYMNTDTIPTLHIEALMYNNCTNDKYDKRSEVKVNLNVTTKYLRVHGLSHDLNFTDVDLIRQKAKTIDDSQEYTITNEGTNKWSNVTAVITVAKNPFIDQYRVTTTQNISCPQIPEQNNEKIIQFKCPLELTPHSTLKIIVTSEIDKLKIVKNWNSGVEISSNFSLSLRPTSNTINERVTTRVFYTIELPVANNKWTIVIIAGIVALIILVILVLILYKVGFFQRKSKKRLDSFKQSIRSRNHSIIQPEPGTSDTNPISDQIDGCDMLDMEVIDDCPFEVTDDQGSPTTTADDATLIDKQKPIKNK